MCVCVCVCVCVSILICCLLSIPMFVSFYKIVLRILVASKDFMKDNGFKLTKQRIRKYPAQTITDADCQIHLPKPKPGYIVWNKQLLA